MGDREIILAAIASRNLPPASATTASGSHPSLPTNSPFDEDHDRRQEFRRLVDPGITRPNSREVADEAIKTLLQLAQNIIDHPDEEKYYRFKPTNTTIRKKIVDPKGALEYAVELGFSPEVIDFQPFYVFKKRRWHDLLIGHLILQEFNEREAAKAKLQAKIRADEKDAIAAQKEKARLAFLDDRKSKMQVDERERELRAARAAKLPTPEPETESTPSQPMPGIGNLLSEVEAPFSPTIVLDE